MGLCPIAAVAYGPVETIAVDVRLRTGGALTGPVVDYTDHGLVVTHNRTPYVFSWGELLPGSAYAVRHALMVFERGGDKENLSAEDHFALGRFALRVGRGDLAARHFRAARDHDASFGDRIALALAAHRRQSAKRSGGAAVMDAPFDTPAAPATHYPDREAAGGPEADATTLALGPLAGRRDEVMAVYRGFGEKVQDVLGREVRLLETDHFLIWTDWAPRRHDRLAAWAESMYDTLCQQFQLDPADEIFLAKCPLFCFRARLRFERFARHFDGFAAVNALGYTRSIEANGHVHVAALRIGRDDADFDRFAYTLVHEGTHAFMHRLYTSKPIPHWINEGLAEVIAERVLGDRCPAAENAALLARQFVRYDWPVRDMLDSQGPIGIHEYPLAMSVVSFLESLGGTTRLAAFIRELKAGKTVADALAAQYDGLTLADLESRWRAHVRRTDEADSRDRRREAAVLPWAP